MKAHNYINIQGWMVTEYKLKPAECIIFAIIYGFTQKEGQVFDLSLRYLQESTLLSRSSVIEKINFLLDKGYLIKDKESRIGEQQRYIAVPVQNLDGCIKDPSEIKTSTRPESKSVPVQKLDAPRPESAPFNNLLNNKSNNKEKTSALFDSIFEIYKKSTSVNSHKQMAFDEFKKLDELKQQKIHDYIKEYFRRREILISQKVTVLSLPAMHRFIKNGYWENVDLPELKQESKPKTSNINMLA